MTARDDSYGLVCARLNLNLDVELLLDALLEVYADALLIDKAATLLYRCLVSILQHLELILRLADQSTECHCDGETCHACARDTYAHSVLKNVCA